jgi:hypothetical protein
MAAKLKEFTSWNSLKGQFTKQLKSETSQVAKAVLGLMGKVHKKYADQQVILVGSHRDHSWRPAVISEDGIYHNICPHCLSKYFNLATRKSVSKYEINGHASSLNDFDQTLMHNQEYYCSNCEENIYSISEHITISCDDYEESFISGDDDFEDFNAVESLVYFDINKMKAHFNGRCLFEQPCHCPSEIIAKPLSFDEINRCIWMKIAYEVNVDSSDLDRDINEMKFLAKTSGVRLHEYPQDWIFEMIRYL